MGTKLEGCLRKSVCLYKGLKVYRICFAPIILSKAFDLIDADRDGNITSEELVKIIKKVGGCMDADEARGLIRKADMDKNGSIDFTEFKTLWSSLKGEDDVKIKPS